jgi:hypothetical protein
MLVETMIQKLSTDIYSNRIKATAPWISYAMAVEYFFTAEKHERIVMLQINIARTYRAVGQNGNAKEYEAKVDVIRTKNAINKIEQI